jgi:hypothetical protein
LAGEISLIIIKIMPTAILALLMVVAGVVTNSGLVSADACVVQLSNSVAATYYSNFQVIVPISTTCSFTGGQLYAVGNAYDTLLNANLGSVNTALVSVNAGSVYAGQLVFNIPSIAQGHTVQITVSIYNGGLNGSILTTATQTVQVPSNYYYNYPSYNYCYPGYNCYIWYYPSYPLYPWYPSPPHHHEPPYRPPHHPRR